MSSCRPIFAVTGKLLEVADLDVGHLQLERAVVLRHVLARRRGGIAIVAEGIAGPQLDHEGDQVPLVANPRHQARQPVLVAVGGRGRAEEVEVGAGVRGACAVLVLVAEPLVDAEVPGGERGGGRLQVIVDRAGHRGGGRRGDILRECRRGGGEQCEGERGGESWVHGLGVNVKIRNSLVGAPASAARWPDCLCFGSGSG